MLIYEPREDSLLLQKEVKKIVQSSDRVLDMGTGSGIQAQTAREITSNVVAVDSNPDAVQRVKELGIQTHVSDLFSNVKGSFDVIIFNPPYLPIEGREDKETARMVAGGKEGHELLERFFKEAKSFLKKEGKIIVLFSSLTGNIPDVLEKLGYKAEKKAEEKHFFETLFVYVVTVAQ